MIVPAAVDGSESHGVGKINGLAEQVFKMSAAKRGVSLESSPEQLRS